MLQQSFWCDCFSIPQRLWASHIGYVAMVSLSSFDLHAAWWPSAVGSVVGDIPSVNSEGFYSVFVLSLFALFFFLSCIHQTFLMPCCLQRAIGVDPDPRRWGDGAIPDTKTVHNGRLVSVIILIGGSVSNNINRGKCLDCSSLNLITSSYTCMHTHTHTLSHTT